MSKALKIGSFCTKGLHLLKSENDIYVKPSSGQRNCIQCRDLSYKKHYLENKERCLSRSKKWAEANKEKVAAIARASHLRRKFCLSGADFLQMKEKQNNACAICQQEPKEFKDSYGRSKSWCVDHDHVTGKIRGLLCCNCNLGLGHFMDNTDFLRQAILYVEQSFK